MTVEALYSVPRPVDIQLSPDGKQALVVLQKPSTNGFLFGQSSLSLLDLASGEMRDLTTANKEGQLREGTLLPTINRATWRRDGRAILWIDSDGQQDQLWSYRLADAKVDRITFGKARIVNFSEAPDGQSIALVKVRRPLRDNSGLLAAEAYFFSDHQDGWWESTYAEPVDIDMLDVRTGDISQVARDLPHAIDLSWDRRGERLLFVPRFETWGGMSAAPLVYNRLTGALTEAVQPESMLRQPIWSPDGSEIAWVEFSLYSRASRTPKQGQWLAGGLFSSLPVIKIGSVLGDRVAQSRTILDENQMARRPIIWNERGLFVGITDNARKRIYRVDPTSGVRRRVTPDNYHVLSYDVSATGTLAAILTNANSPSEIFVGNVDGGSFHKLTDFAKELPFKPVQVRAVQWRSGDDRFDVHGWLVTPPNYDPTKRYPMVTELHGATATIEDDFWRIQTENVPPAIHASRGYVVLLPNPRGDHGYSPDYAKAIIGNLAKGPVELDILPGVEAMVKAGVADPEKLAISGFSMGGMNVAWAISHTHQFKAAALSDAPVNLLSHWGQGYPFNSTWIDWAMEGSPNEKMREYIERSPITYASNIDTPLLMRYTFGDAKLWNGTFGLQGKELQAVLHDKGVPTEIQIEPHSVHAPRTVRSLQLWADAASAWFDHYVLGKPYVLPRPCAPNTDEIGEVRDAVCVLDAPR